MEKKYEGKIRIMPLGDSITQGNDKEEYRTELWKLLSIRQIDFEFVGTSNNGSDSLPFKDNEGHGGFTIGPDNSFVGNIYDNISEYMEKDPHVILMLLGCNDFFRDNVDYQTSPQRLAGLIDKIYEIKPDVQLFVASLTQVNWDKNFGADFNAAIPNIVKERQKLGREIFFVDMRNECGFDISTDLKEDGLHPTQSGFNKIAKVWYDNIISYLE